MAYRTKPAEPLPASAIRSRQSECRKIYYAAAESDTNTVAVEADSPKELTAIYKSMIQWRKRHKDDMPCKVNKDGELIYVTAEQSKHGDTSEGAD